MICDQLKCQCYPQTDSFIALSDMVYWRQSTIPQVSMVPWEWQCGGDGGIGGGGGSHGVCSGGWHYLK